MMTFTNPIWLWGLMGLSIPLLLHLWSRRETKVLEFSSIRFLRESISKRSKKLAFSDFWLWFIRSLHIIVLVLLMSGLQINTKPEPVNILISGDAVALNTDFKTGFRRVKSPSIKDTALAVNPWPFIFNLPYQYPGLDSVIWIDDFDKFSFFGAKPNLSFNLQIIDQSNKESEKDQSFLKDSVTYHIKLAKADSMIVERMLQAIISYTKKNIAFKKTKESPFITFSNDLMTSLDSKTVFVFSDYTKDEIQPQYIGQQKIIQLHNTYLSQPVERQQLLVIIAENIAQYVNPDFQFKPDRIYNSEGLNTSVKMKNTAWQHMEALLLLIFTLLFLTERYLTIYKRKQIG